MGQGRAGQRAHRQRRSLPLHRARRPGRHPHLEDGSEEFLGARLGRSRLRRRTLRVRTHRPPLHAPRFRQFPSPGRGGGEGHQRIHHRRPMFRGHPRQPRLLRRRPQRQRGDPHPIQRRAGQSRSRGRRRNRPSRRGVLRQRLEHLWHRLGPNRRLLYLALLRQLRGGRRHGFRLPRRDHCPRIRPPRGQRDQQYRHTGQLRPSRMHRNRH